METPEKYQFIITVQPAGHDDEDDPDFGVKVKLGDIPRESIMRDGYSPSPFQAMVVMFERYLTGGEEAPRREVIERAP